MIKPLLDRVLLEKVEQEKKTASGIILSDASKEKSYLAKVIAVGPGKVEDGKLIEVGVKVDDLVIYKQYAPTEVKYENKEYLILDAKDILAIVE
jgi:chaperonin GroES